MKLLEIINKAENLCANLECDGTTRVLNYLLTTNNITHEVKCGSLDMGNEHVPLHYWIELPGETIIDLKAKMWLKNKKAPHGVFKKSDTKAVYSGETIDMRTSETIFKILTYNF